VSLGLIGDIVADLVQFVDIQIL